MSENERILNNPNYKIGIKELTLEQLREGLPNYEVLLERIEKIRFESSNANIKDLEQNTFEALKYDNIFSILGGRGAGKTSVLFTLYKTFKSEKSNIMIPIVMPELLDKNENIISWILSAMEKGLNDIETEIQKVNIDHTSDYYKKMCDDYGFFDRCIFNKQNKLRQKFNKLKLDFYNNENKNFGNNYSENTELMAQSTKSGFELIPKFIEYWNALIDVYGKYLKAIGNEEDKPLIFIFIDDADLKPEIINDLLFVIPKYLSHPNVVVFISGSQKTLSLAVRYHMYKAITHSPYDIMDLMDVEYKYNGNSYRDENISHIKFDQLRYGREFHKINNLSEEILRKLFPVYNRFQIKKYDSYDTKRSFRMFKDDDASCAESIRFSDKIARLLGSYYNNVMKLHEKHRNSITINSKSEPSAETYAAKTENFNLIKRNEDTGYFLENESYLSFFGQYSRDISAVYYALKEMLESLGSILKNLYKGVYGLENDRIPLSCIENTRDVLIKFLDAAIISNKKLSMFSKHPNDMVKTQLLRWQLYIDYSKVLEIFKKPEYMESNLNNLDPFVEMLCLLNFIEQIIVLMMPQRRKSHGIDEMCEFMKNAGIEVIQYNDNIDEIFKQYFVFHSYNIIPHFDINKIEHQNNFINGISELGLLNNINNRGFINHNWIILLTNVFFKRYSLVARLSKYKTELLLFNNRRFLDKNYIDLKNEYYNYLKERIFNNNDDDINDIKNTIEIVKNSMVVEKMEISILFLDRSFESSETYIKGKIDDITAYISLLDVYGSKKIKNEVLSLIKYIEQRKIIRYELIRRLNNIIQLIENDENNYMDLIVWYNNFEKMIWEKIDFVDSSYQAIIDDIKALFPKYIDYYIIKLKNEVSNENQNNPIGINNKKLRSIIYPYMDIIEQREWRKLTESE